MALERVQQVYFSFGLSKKSDGNLLGVSRLFSLTSVELTAFYLVIYLDFFIFEFHLALLTLGTFCGDFSQRFKSSIELSGQNAEL